MWAAAEFRMLLDRALSSPLAHVFQGHPTVWKSRYLGTFIENWYWLRMPKKKLYLDKCKFVVHGLIKEPVAICYNAKYFKLKKRKSHVGQPERCYNSVISLDSISTILNQITTRSGKF